ncbi:hypothetical protein [Pseudidiomarina sp.]
MEDLEHGEAWHFIIMPDPTSPFQRLPASVVQARPSWAVTALLGA